MNRRQKKKRDDYDRRLARDATRKLCVEVWGLDEATWARLMDVNDDKPFTEDQMFRAGALLELFELIVTWYDLTAEELAAKKAPNAQHVYTWAKRPCYINGRLEPKAIDYLLGGDDVTERINSVIKSYYGRAYGEWG